MFKITRNVTRQEIVKEYETAAQVLDWMAALVRNCGVINIASAAEFKQAVNQLPEEYLRTFRVNGEDLRVWVAANEAKYALKVRYHSDDKNGHSPRSSIQRRRVLPYQVNHNDLSELDLPLPAEKEFRVRGASRRKAKAPAQTKTRSWKEQTRARSQWARHMEGLCRCYIKQGESSESLFSRLAKEGFPVVPAN